METIATLTTKADNPEALAIVGMLVKDYDVSVDAVHSDGNINFVVEV